MPLPPEYYRITLHFSSTETSAKATSALWYMPASGGATPPTLATVAAFANGFRTAYLTALQAALPDVCQMDKLTLKYVNGGNEVEGDNTNGPIVGSVANPPLPEEDVWCIQRRTGGVGRNRRGRVFFPFVPDGFEENGQLNAGGLAAAALLAAMVKSDVTANGVSFKPHTPNWKDGQLLLVVQTGYVTSTCSRRDRRFPKQLSSIRI